MIDKETADTIIAWSIGLLLGAPLAGWGGALVWAYRRDVKEIAARRYLEHEQERLKRGEAPHERCECQKCVVWRRRLSA